MKALQIYILLVNIAAFLIMGIDKHRAQRNKWRISESSIFAAGIIGGALGIYFGMSFFHHKTKHLKFTLGIPMEVILNIVMFGYILQKLK